MQCSFLTKAVYDPKAFIPHAASHHQTFVHCERFSTAASRRSLGSVSVPVWPVTLSGRLPVKCLGEPLPHQQADRTQTHPKVVGPKVPTFTLLIMRLKEDIEYYHRFHDALFVFREDCLRVTHPFAAISQFASKLTNRSTCMPNPRRQRSL